MVKARVCAVALLVLAWAYPAGAQLQDTPPWSADLGAIRRVAVSIPGASPTRVNVIKVAESRRTKNFAVRGMPNQPSVQARTAYQVIYPGGSIMIDAGMDLQVHRFFGRGVEEPYFQDQADVLEQALRAARAIVLTHEHGDHVGGIIRSSYFDVLAPKTRLTRTQMQLLMTNPQMPELALTPGMARQFLVIDYEDYFPVSRHGADQGSGPHARLADGLCPASVGPGVGLRRRCRVAHGRHSPASRQGRTMDHRG